MFEHISYIRVRYGETDQMGYVYYGNYSLYYEQGRTEAIKSLGVSYKSLEERGVMMPVAEMKVRYKGPAKYDELLTVVTKVTEMPSRSMHFNTAIYNEAHQLINEGDTRLMFVKTDTRKPCSAPEELLEALKPHFKLTV
ncbi:thioesterase family protein [soil metagenome]